MKMLCGPGLLSGSVRAIPSKSDAHRLLICAALADRPTTLHLPGWQGEDIAATLRCLTALGASFAQRQDAIWVTPMAGPVPSPVLDCGESGSTLRFLLPVAAALGCGAIFTGSGRLPQRPIGPLLEALEHGGVRASDRALPLRLEGKLRPGRYALPGDVSSQFITGLLLALPLTGGGGEIELLGPLESVGYVDMTRSSLSNFGVSVQASPKGYGVPPGQGYRSPGEAWAQGDWSNAAFFLVAGALAGPVRYEGLRLPSTQGDAAVFDILARWGARMEAQADRITVACGEARRALTLDVREIPDLLPILAVAAAVTPGVTRFTNAARLRLKESDRLASVARMIGGLGGRAWEEPEGLGVEGQPALRGGSVHCAGDHRIAMAGAIAATLCSGETVLEGAEAVNKSYPSFFEDFQKLGGKCHVLDAG
ncbi:MAG: 3-phosphoshikimate 1-carboxyvinyltransferase [Candidatus Limiplasma sp.]|nr:3-phosphoshikimate 1-carboxyvinyltransferase [Candidatus Limiplasma sp.]